MKFPKLIAASLAALAMFSCSKEVIDNNGPEIKPGDARIVFKTGAQATTYASHSEEVAVNQLQVFMAYMGPDNLAQFTEIPTGNITTSGSETASLDYIVPSGTYKEGSTATLYFVANATSITATSLAELRNVVEEKNIYSVTNQGALNTLMLNGGMTATREIEIVLTPGVISTGVGLAGNGNVALKRLAARVYAISGTGNADDIKGYTVEITNNLSKGANLFTYAGSGTGTATGVYIIKGDATGQYQTTINGTLTATEAVGYLYPASNVDITVNDGANDVTKSFSPTANKNYKLIITPAIAVLPRPTFTIEIVEWEEGETEVEIDFNPPIANPFATLASGLTYNATSTKAVLVVPPAYVGDIDIDPAYSVVSLETTTDIVTYAASEWIARTGNKLTISYNGASEERKAKLTLSKAGSPNSTVYIVSPVYSAKLKTGGFKAMTFDPVNNVIYFDAAKHQPTDVYTATDLFENLPAEITYNAASMASNAYLAVVDNLTDFTLNVKKANNTGVDMNLSIAIELSVTPIAETGSAAFTKTVKLVYVESISSNMTRDVNGVQWMTINHGEYDAAEVVANIVAHPTGATFEAKLENYAKANYSNWKEVAGTRTSQAYIAQGDAAPAKRKCPVGYRLPTQAETLALVGAANTGKSSPANLARIATTALNATNCEAGYYKVTNGSTQLLFFGLGRTDWTSDTDEKIDDNATAGGANKDNFSLFASSTAGTTIGVQTWSLQHVVMGGTFNWDEAGVAPGSGSGLHQRCVKK